MVMILILMRILNLVIISNRVEIIIFEIIFMLKLYNDYTAEFAVVNRV